ncbi:MAG: hypothetical protein K940chlam5_00515 [Candidatus Anoxychlamydiales bacterium]|nr:hypothetical protein [Candidatus Anoxychlamydiales bacterium]
MSFITPRIDTAPLRKAYDAVNSTMNDLNSQVVKHNAKTVIKTSLVFASIVAASIFTMFAAASLLGYAFPVLIGKTLLIEMVVGITALRMIEKTFGKIMYNKIERNTDEFLSKINADLNKSREDNIFSVPEASYIKMSLDLCAPEFKSSRYTIEERKMNSFEVVERAYTSDLQKAKDEEAKRRQEEKNSGLFRFLPSFRREASA